MFFSLPEDARWNTDRQAVEFGVEIGEYSGVVRVPRRGQIGSSEGRAAHTREKMSIRARSNLIG